MIMFISATQGPISLSTGESEWYGLARTGSAVIGLVNMALDYGRHLRGRLRVDATAAAGIASRRGVGKVRHLDTATLWLQQHVTTGALEVKHTPGAVNPADLGTKHLDRKTMMKHVEKCGFVVATGNSGVALRADL